MERRIYIACLESYNAGRLVGAWLDLTDFVDCEALEVAAKAAIKGEEWAIHDHEGFYNLMGEYTPLAQVFELHETLTEAEENHSAEVIAAAMAIADKDEWLQALENFCGSFDRQGDYAYECADQAGELDSIPERYRNHIDWEAIERDDEISGDISVCTVNGTRYIFGQW